MPITKKESPFKGAKCQICNSPLHWPEPMPDDSMLCCPNGHEICTMAEFRQAAYEMALREEIQIRRIQPLDSQRLSA
ncbi:hypothetical protein A5892_10385 [Halotalea alkalilenta]|uniref:Uncharacterized protein n=1 Tax=Halotalea alkalilenta TaxID=376489 RepID=A0A172YEX0_9GAMM|nr:hypothetical protein A5892_10385 [Halotalea alkalilenta]